jgi:DNA-binding winged helix-turn-helix (wHTH) protein
VWLGLLGELTAHVDGRALELGPAKQRCVLAALAVEAPRLVPADRLVDRVWGSDVPHRGRQTLYSYLSRLRRALSVANAVEIVNRSGGYALVLDQPVETVDLHRFRDLCARARARTDDAQAARLLTEALKLWRGQALTGLDGEWVAAERDRLNQERLDAEHALTDVMLRLGHGPDLVAELGTLHTAIRSQKLREHADDTRGWVLSTAQLALVLARLGRCEEALLTQPYHPLLLTLAANALGDAHHALGQPHLALDHYHLAHDTAERIGYRRQQDRARAGRTAPLSHSQVVRSGRVNRSSVEQQLAEARSCRCATSSATAQAAQSSSSSGR